MSAPPRLRKAARVMGKTLAFRDAGPQDAAFILSLRTDPEKSRYLSATPADVAAQRAWLTRYAVADDQAYFIIDYQGAPVGTVRLYDAQEHSFCWGSWILAVGRPQHAAMESALMVYAYALDHLGFTAAHFDVRKGNERVWQFHERFGARRVAAGLFIHPGPGRHQRIPASLCPVSTRWRHGRVAGVINQLIPHSNRS